MSALIERARKAKADRDRVGSYYDRLWREAVVDAHREHSLRELARELDVPHSNLHRIVQAERARSA
jgi:hypothetical protein